MRIAFMGTPDFSVDCLKALVASKHEIVGVFCQPDKPVGRKQELTPPDVKVEALKHNLKVFQPVSLRNGKGTEILKEIEPELVVVVAYGKILPDDFLSFPKYGCINVHASILPKYRGASPIHHAVLYLDPHSLQLPLLPVDKAGGQDLPRQGRHQNVPGGAAHAGGRGS